MHELICSDCLNYRKGAPESFSDTLTILSFSLGMREEATYCYKGQMQEHKEQIQPVFSPLAVYITRRYKSNDAL